MSIRRIATVLIVTLLLVCTMVTTAFACECGGHHRTYAANPEANTKLVTQAQNQLKALGYKFTARTGVVSSSMRTALRSFQYDAALDKTGKLNNCTLYRLESRANAVKTNRASRSWMDLFKGDYRLLEIKRSSGNRVKTMNNALYALGFGTNKIKNSSTFSSYTYQAVVQFQKKYVRNRQADGKAGPYTLSTLEKVYGSKFKKK